jgi:hypothetical protein
MYFLKILINPSPSNQDEVFGDFVIMIKGYNSLSMIVVWYMYTTNYMLRDVSSLVEANTSYHI